VVDGKLIIAHRQGSEVVVDALEAATGKGVWKFSYATDYRDSFGMDDGPRATPAVSEGLVFVHGAEGMLHALSLTDGKLLWKVDTVKEFNSPQGFFGRVCAPLVSDGKVILTTGGTKAVVAFDAKDGHVAWSSGNEEASYASPVLSSPKTLTCWLRDNLTTLDLTSGKILSAERFRPAIEASVSAATPIKTDHGWFVSAEYDVGGSLWDIGDDGSRKKTWSGDDGINCHYATPVYHEGCVYGFDGRQESGQTLRCWSTATHEVKWNSPRVRGGTLLIVKDKLVVLTESGELWVVRATPEKFETLLSTLVLRAGHRSYAAYSNGVFVARDREKLIAVSLAQ
jgi:outer membrane protein assembly factor BamB